MLNAYTSSVWSFKLTNIQSGGDIHSLLAITGRLMLGKVHLNNWVAQPGNFGWTSRSDTWRIT